MEKGANDSKWSHTGYIGKTKIIDCKNDSKKGIQKIYTTVKLKYEIARTWKGWQLLKQKNQWERKNKEKKIIPIVLKIEANRKYCWRQN